jgi:imidazole glycerol-phosphate synthase subunit HisF
MLKHRLIPVLLLKNGMLVRSEEFTIHQVIGKSNYEARRFNEWNVDELVYLEISGDSDDDNLKILEAVAETCFMPLTWGGNIKSVQGMRERFKRGADKIVVNSEAFRNPSLVSDGAKLFGSQAIVVSVDVKLGTDCAYYVYIDGGKTNTGVTVEEWVVAVEKHGAGEILLQSIDRDGTGQGFDIDLIKSVTSLVNIPVIACSGVGTYEHYAAGILKGGASAVAAANIWHFKELSDRGGKRALMRANVNVRSNVKFK